MKFFDRRFPGCGFARQASRFAAATCVLAACGCSSVQRPLAKTPTDPFLDDEARAPLASPLVEEQAGRVRLAIWIALPIWSAWPWLTSMRSHVSTVPGAPGRDGFANHGSNRTVTPPGVASPIQAWPYPGVDVDPVDASPRYPRPRPFSVMGFHAISFARFVTPSLTTMKQPRSKIGAVAMDLLLAVVEGDVIAQKQVLLRSELILRNSVARLGRDSDA